METTSDKGRKEIETPSGTVTFLFTDIEGSTKLLEQLRDQYAVLLEDQQRILRSAFAHWSGHEIDTQGDSFFAVFPRAIDAIGCVIEAQRELAAHEWPHGAVVRVRMGLHTGEPIQVQDRYIGMDVHRAARIAAAGHGMQVLLSLSTRQLVFQDLPKGTSLRDLGEHKLKDIRYPQQIYQLDIDGLPLEFPPLKTLSIQEETPTPGEPPYRGLQYFDEADADWFFGRELVSNQLVQALLDQRFLAVIGASGSGKSSVVRAGVVPALKRNYPGRWQVHIFTPSSHPLESLSVSLTRGEQSVTATATLIDDLRRDPRSLHLYIRRLVPQDSQTEFLIIVDQFEELFTQCRDEAERQAFVDNLLYAIEAVDGPSRVVIALRADFYQHLAQYSGLRTEVARRQEYLGAMDADELRQAIDEPARRGGWEFSPGLVDLMLYDIGAAEGRQPEPGALPLLSHALLETWKRRRGNQMNLKAYSEAGGVRGAIARTAESVFYRELTPAQQHIARNIFLRLIELGEGTPDTRRRAEISELVPSTPNSDPKMVEEVLVKLADARLITTTENSAEVAHEALIREWPTLREWLVQDREGLRTHRQLTDASREWERLKRDPGALLRGARLEQFAEWSQTTDLELAALERDFLQASLALRDQEKNTEIERLKRDASLERRRRNLSRALIATLSIGLILSIGLLAFAFDRQRQAIANLNLSEAQRLAAESNRLAVEDGPPDLIALLALQSIQKEYTSQGDQALVGASHLNFAKKILGGPGTPIKLPEFSPDGRMILGSQGGQVYIWDTQTGDLLRHVQVTEHNVNAVVFSPDSRAFLTSEIPPGPPRTGESVARLWDAQTGKLLREYKGHKGHLLIVAFSSDGHLIMTGGAGNVELWNADTGVLIWQFQSNGRPALSPDGKKLATIADFDILVWDTATGEQLLRLPGHSGPINVVIFSPDSRMIGSGSNDRTARLWDAETGALLQNLENPDLIWDLAFSPNGLNLATSQVNLRTVTIWDGQTGAMVRRIGPVDGIEGLAFSPDGQTIATSGPDGIRLWDAQPDPGLPIFTVGEGFVVGLAYAQDGKTILAGGWGNTVGLFDARTGIELRRFSGHTGEVNGVAFSPDGSKAISASWDDTARVWDVQTGEQGLVLTSTLSLYSAVFSPDGTHILTVPGDGMIGRIWDAASGKLVCDLQGQRTGFYFAAYSPDGRMALTGSGEGPAVLWDAATCQFVREFKVAGTGAYAVAYSPNGKMIATGAIEGLVQVWDAQTGEEIRRFLGHNNAVWGVAFSPDGSTVASASYDNTARLWDVATGKEIRRFVGHKAGLENVIFSPDGRYILTGGDDSTARLWYVNLDDVINDLCARLPRDLTDNERAEYGIIDSGPSCPLQ